MSADPTPDPLKSDYLQRPDVQGYLLVLEVLRDWDPIGVISATNRDEYDHYAPELIRMLDARASSAFVGEWLIDLAANHMALSFVDKHHSHRCAERLTEFWRAWKGK